MNLRARVLLAVAAVATIAAVTFTAATLGPDTGGRWLLFSAVLATIAAVQAAASDPADLAAALLLSLPPVVALLADGSPTWLMGPFGALLLLAAELNALSWDCLAHEPMNAVKRRRLRSAVALAGVGLVAALFVGVV